MLKLSLMLKRDALAMAATLDKSTSMPTILDLLEGHANNTSLTTCNVKLHPLMNARTAPGLHPLLERMARINAGL